MAVRLVEGLMEVFLERTTRGILLRIEPSYLLSAVGDPTLDQTVRMCRGKTTAYERGQWVNSLSTFACETSAQPWKLLSLLGDTGKSLYVRLRI